MSPKTLVFALGAALALGAATAAPKSGGETAAALRLAVPQTVEVSDQLPDVAVGPVSVRNMAAFAALRLVLEKSAEGIGLTYRTARLPAALRRPVAATNLEGRLPVLVEQLAQVAGFWWSYDAASRVVTVSEDRQFTLELPAESGRAEVLKRELPKLGAQELSSGHDSATVTYWAKRHAAERIAEYFGTRVGASAGSDMPVTPPGLPAASTSSTWQIKAGDRVAETLAQWAKTGGWQLAWEGPDLLAQADASLGGTFEQAVTELVRALNRSGAGLRPIFYEGNRMLRITEWK